MAQVNSGLGYPIDVNLDASGNFKVAGNMSSASATLTRPSDTTAYAAKDVVTDSTSSPTVLEFSDIANVVGGSGYIVKAILLTNQSTNTSRFRLHLYHTAPTAINDNSPFTLLWANRVNRIGYLDFVACSTEGTGSDMAQSQSDTVRLPFITSATKHLYGLLESLDAFTPASAQLFYIVLNADVN